MNKITSFMNDIFDPCGLFSEHIVETQGEKTINWLVYLSDFDELIYPKMILEYVIDKEEVCN